MLIVADDHCNIRRRFSKSLSKRNDGLTASLFFRPPHVAVYVALQLLRRPGLSKALEVVHLPAKVQPRVLMVPLRVKMPLLYGGTEHGAMRCPQAQDYLCHCPTFGLSITHHLQLRSFGEGAGASVKL